MTLQHQKDNFIFLGTSGFGECIFATPFLEYWSQFYNIIFVVKNNYVSYFSNYKFIKDVIGMADQSIMSLNDLACKLEKYKNLGITYVSCIFPNGLDSIHKHKLIFSFLTPWQYSPHPVNPHYGPHTNVFIRHGVSKEITLKYDKSYRCPIETNKDGAKRIILYMGSREVIRRLPYEIFNKIQRKLTELTNFEIWCIYESTWDDLIDKHSNIRYFRNNNSEEDSIRICELFSKGVDLMIGPDSGLTNMAICFNIKQLWMETRDRPEMTIPPEQLHLLHIYRKKKPICLQNCRARTHARMFGEDLLDHLKYIPNCKNTVQELECFKDTQSHCLDFDDIEIDELFNMIKNITTE